MGRLKDLLIANCLDGFIHFQTNKANDNVTLHYLSGVRRLQDAGVIIPLDSDPVLIVKQFEQERVNSATRIEDVRAVVTTPLDNGLRRIKEVIEEKGLIGKRVGVDDIELTLEVFNKFRSLDVELVPFGSSIRLMRMVKTRQELENIRKAVELATLGLKTIESIARDGLTEMEFAAEASATMERHGGEKSFVSVQYAENAAIPHKGSSARKVGSNGLLLVDLGARVNGYTSDLTRTFVLGSPPNQQTRLVKLVEEAINQSFMSVVSGQSVEGAAKKARSILGKNGLPQPKHSIGHGIGLSVHEMPTIEEGEPYVFGEGMVVTIEPAVYLPGITGCRIETDVAITGQGAEMLDTKLFPLSTF
ncbi:MAG: aminopeptidase P family protein [Nitrososphaerota archaeon]|nr:aminopeptidase P family protein [Nitrososphaerota archaeon]